MIQFLVQHIKICVVLITQSNALDAKSHFHPLPYFCLSVNFPRNILIF